MESIRLAAALAIVSLTVACIGANSVTGKQSAYIDGGIPATRRMAIFGDG